jgi:hypothetical protein
LFYLELKMFFTTDRDRALYTAALMGPSGQIQEVIP